MGSKNTTSAIWTDETEMTFGKYKGVQLADIPDSYLLWFWHENKAKALLDDNLALWYYIKDSFNEKDLK